MTGSQSFGQHFETMSAQRCRLTHFGILSSTRIHLRFC